MNFEDLKLKNKYIDIFVSNVENLKNSFSQNNTTFKENMAKMLSKNDKILYIEKFLDKFGDLSNILYIKLYFDRKKFLCDSESESKLDIISESYYTKISNKDYICISSFLEDKYNENDKVYEDDTYINSLRKDNEKNGNSSTKLKFKDTPINFIYYPISKFLFIVCKYKETKDRNDNLQYTMFLKSSLYLREKVMNYHVFEKLFINCLNISSSTDNVK